MPWPCRTALLRAVFPSCRTLSSPCCRERPSNANAFLLKPCEPGSCERIHANGPAIIFMRTPCERPTCERSCEHIPANMVLRTRRPLSAHREFVHLTLMPDGRQYLSMDVLAAKRRRYLARVSGGSPRTQRSHETPRRTHVVLGRDPCRLPALHVVDHAHGRKRPWA